MWYEFYGLTETQVGWTRDPAVAKAVAEALGRKHVCTVSYEAVGANHDEWENWTDLVCDADTTIAEVDPSVERFPNILAVVTRDRLTIRPSQIIDLFDLPSGDVEHDDFVKLTKDVWEQSTCTHADWLKAFAEDEQIGYPVFATDKWVLEAVVLGADVEICHYRWSGLSGKAVPAGGIIAD